MQGKMLKKQVSHVSREGAVLELPGGKNSIEEFPEHNTAGFCDCRDHRVKPSHLGSTGRALALWRFLKSL